MTDELGLGVSGVVAFAFGSPSAIRSNRWIAETAMLHSRESQSSLIFTQDDVQFSSDSGLEATYCNERMGDPPPIMRIAREAVQWAIAYNIRDITVVAGKPHMWRCVRDMQEAVKEQGATGLIHIRKSQEIFRFLEDDWFCADSMQGYTQIPRAWERRERILCHMPLWFYKLVAS